ncbi:MAG TPA: ABC transporter transmembrane domain-containing protein, partial [Gemmatimonadaceae bacterium]
ANKSRSPLAWLRGNFVGSEAWLVQSVFAGLVYALLGIATSLCIQVLIDRLIPAHEVGRLISLGWLLVVLTLARSAVGLLRQHFLVEVGLRVNKQVAEGFLSRAFRLPMRFFDTRTKGDIASRLHDATKIQTAITRVLGTSVTDIFIIAGALLYIALFASALVPLALTCVFVYTAVMAVATRSLKAEQRLVMQSSAVLEGAYVDSLNGIAEIRAYSVPRLFEHLTQRLFQDVQGRSKSFALTQARASLCAEAVGGLLVLVALIYGAILVSSGEMQLGQMIAAYSLLASTVSPLTRLVDAHIAVQGASLAAVRLTDLAEAEEETSSGDRKFALQTGIEVQRLRFSWPRGDVLFADLSLEIPCGRITGMWGLSGSGKSTLVRILQRMYAPVSGQILVDGIPATAIELTLYRRGVAVVSASTKIFNMTLEENILLGRHEPGGGGPAPIPADRLANLIRDTGLTPFFERFPAGLSSEIGERGRTLSSGERQVVGLLRALVSSPSLLLIDEGLNALDADVSRVVWQALKLYAKQHAILLIAHDLNVLLETDFIYVLENGSITEEGPADALLGESGRLSQLWSARGCKRAALPSASRSFSMVPSRQSI